MPKIFIDGSAGTTGLRIHERIAELGDIELLTIPDELRKDVAEKKRLINSADLVYLCLPDDAAKESVSLCENPDTVIIDASTAHRINPDWAYGFPELSDGHYQKILESKRIAVPGCYATAFIALVYPLVAANIIPRWFPLSASAVSGYSGAGKKGIADYESADRPKSLSAPRAYGLNQNHKHLPEMREISNMTVTPFFCPSVDDYYSGILLQIPLFVRNLPKRTTVEQLRELYAKHYNGHANIIIDDDPPDYISANDLADTDDIKITVSGNTDNIVLTSRLDNLGKGASGAAIQLGKIKLGK
ncbi:MAG: N-acetyl-gamma-glutamyl-phosphate reductase [Oscillospiraceae bacterium]|jgi:N-acetyl-gamma-glutamyl-phosphate reductase|nr:N-acetyl-gamma-glutamyl-phosphate reductase [Oscillospiraceae bacterium]